MSKRITIEELQTYLWNSAVLLRTNIDAGAYKQYIFPLVDMFPLTRMVETGRKNINPVASTHVESVVLMSKVNTAMT